MVGNEGECRHFPAKTGKLRSPHGVTSVEIDAYHDFLSRDRTMIRKLCLLVVAALLVSAPSSASAYWPYFGYGGFGQSGYGLGYNYASNYVPAPPYYSIYPPVYYSHQITARHYGASPFAWPAGFSPTTYVPQGEITGPDPVVIENPFASSAKAAAKATATTADQPVAKEISNPFAAAASSEIESD